MQTCRTMSTMFVRHIIVSTGTILLTILASIVAFSARKLATSNLKVFTANETVSTIRCDKIAVILAIL